MHYRIALSALSLLFVLSCKCDRNTYVLGEEENVFIPYELGNTVRFKNLVTGDTIQFEVVFDEIRDYEEGGGPSAMVGFPKFCQGSSDDTHQEREFRLESSECSMTYSVGTEGSPAAIGFFLGSCGILSYGDNRNNPLIQFGDGTYFTNDTLYDNVFELPSSSSRILVAHGIGILSFVDAETWEEYVFID